MSEGEMDLGQGTEIREYLLGLADEECSGWVEQRLLNGSIGAEQIQLIEDELIDEYLLGGLPPRERTAFAANFLTTAERRQRLAFSRQMIQRAQAEPLPARPADSPAARSQLRPWSFSWRWTAIASMAASILLFALLAFQTMRLGSARQTARNAQSAASRLRPAGGSAGSAGSADSAGSGAVGETARLEQPSPDLTLSPTTRDLERTPMLTRPQDDQLVRVRLLLPDLGKTPYRERLIAPLRGQLWMQEFDDAGKQAPPASDLDIPASLLSPGGLPVTYRIDLELPEDPGCPQKAEKAACKWYELETYEFSVPAK